MGNETAKTSNVSNKIHQRRTSETMSMHDTNKSFSQLSITSRTSRFNASSSQLRSRCSGTPVTPTTATNSSQNLTKLSELPELPQILELSPPVASPKSVSAKSVSPPVTSVGSTTSITHKRKLSFLLNVNNGITGVYISSRICKIAAKFWKNHIEPLSVAQQTEIGCAIFFSMMASNSGIKKIMKSQSLCSKTTIEETSVKYLDMMGWLIRHLVTDGIDLDTLLIKLGALHQQKGINIQHFNPMLQSMHETFSYYFDTTYNIEIKYAMDEIFSLAAQVMTGQELKLNSHLHNITQQFQDDNIPFLKNLQTCLKSSLGREYLYRYLAQTWCDEIAIFLKSLYRFKKQMSSKERFMVARDITKSSIYPTATFCLNLSYENRMDAMNKMKMYNERFVSKDVKFEFPVDFFSDVERETYKLIMDNHWKRFVEDIETLQSKSFNVE